ncbi:MAG TPA: RNA polymerase sigma factor [Candidatus Paceibacterota bacterium]|nr:RNA polymerase sigma factor [Candidatus Paceibacterota bacterium]
MRKEEQEFGDAYERYNDELFRHCSLRLSDRERAVEITQEAFLKAWQYIEKGEVVREMRPFLYRTLHNLIIDEYRKMKSLSLEALVQNDEGGGDIESLMPADETNTLEAAIDRFEGSRALEALKKLPDTYREVLVMRYVDSLSPKEIADAIGESENAVSVRVHRGLKKLKTLLEPEETSIKP